MKQRRQDQTLGGEPRRESRADSAALRRELRGRIARARRRVDQHRHRVLHAAPVSIDWREHVHRYPVWSLLGSFAVGLLISSRALDQFMARWWRRFLDSTLEGAAVSAWDRMIDRWFGGARKSARARQTAGTSAEGASNAAHP